MIGATVSVVGSKNVVTTDIEGKFSLNNIRKGDKLNVSYFGCDPAKLTVKDSSPVNLTLYPSASDLNEVVVIGYGTTERKRVTTAISSVKEKTFCRVWEAPQ